MDQVTFSPPPPLGITFATARADLFNPGVALPLDGLQFSSADFFLFTSTIVFTPR